MQSAFASCGAADSLEELALQMRPDVLTEAQRLVQKKIADKYIGRAGEPPSILNRAKAARLQDVSEDDRKHLEWCIGKVQAALAYRFLPAKMQADAEDAFAFIEAILERDYALYRGRDTTGYGTGI